MNLRLGCRAFLIAAAEVTDGGMQNNAFSKANGVCASRITSGPFDKGYLQLITYLNIALTLWIARYHRQHHAHTSEGAFDERSRKNLTSHG